LLTVSRVEAVYIGGIWGCSESFQYRFRD